MEKTERELRIQLAACYRIFDYMNMEQVHRIKLFLKIVEILSTMKKKYGFNTKSSVMKECL